MLDNGLSDATRSRLLEVVHATGRSDGVRWIRIPPDERLRPFETDSRLTPSTYSRLLIPEFMPAHIRRAIYLDADLLIREDLAPLFEADLGDAPIGAVRDFAIPITTDEASGVRDRSQPRPYFNAGVLVMDMPRWRNTRLADRALEYAAAGEHPLPNREQDALNAVAGNWAELDFRWNVQHTYFPKIKPPALDGVVGSPRRQRRTLYRNAAVLHFIGEPKPWYRYCATPGTTAWGRDLIRSGWYSRGETLSWVLRYARNRARYWLGTKKRQLGRMGRG